MDVVTNFPADAQPAEVMEQGEGLLDDPAVFTQARAMLGAAPCDERANAQGANLPAVLVVVVAAIGQEDVGPSAGPSALAAHRRDRLR